MRTAVFGLVLGLIASVVVYLIERTTNDIAWLLIYSFPVCWTISGYLFEKWNIGGKP